MQAESSKKRGKRKKEEVEEEPEEYATGLELALLSHQPRSC